MSYDPMHMKAAVAARRMEKRKQKVWRIILILIVAILAITVLDFVLPKAPGADLTFSFHRQPNERKHTPWYLCVENLSAEPAHVRLSDIYRAAAGHVALYDPGRLREVMRHKPRAKWIRILGIAGAATSVVIPFANAHEVWANAIGPVVSGGAAIAVPAIEANQQFEVGIEGYWTTDEMLDAGEARCSRVMSARSNDTLATFTFEMRDMVAETFHVEPSREPPAISSVEAEPAAKPVRVAHSGVYLLPGDDPGQSGQIVAQLECRPSAVVAENGVEPCPWVE